LKANGAKSLRSKLVPHDWVTAEIDQDGVEVVLKPVPEIFEAPISGPCGWNAIPAIQLLFKNHLAPLVQMLARLFFRYRTREAGRSLVPASDRSGLDAHSLDPPDAASPRMAGLVGQRLLIVFISVPSNPLRLPDDSNNSASRPNVVCAGLRPACLLAGLTQ